MIRTNAPHMLIDGYKAGHPDQYPTDTTLVYSNFTPRKSYGGGDDGIVFFGLQAFIERYLCEQFNDFFESSRASVCLRYSAFMVRYLGVSPAKAYEMAARIGRLHDLGYLPLHIKALPEGTFVPYGVPVLTIRNTHPEFFWLTNMLETVLSCEIWQTCTSATSARWFRKTLEAAHARTVGGDSSFVMWQGHDFSMRGMPGVDAARSSGAGHLTSFFGTDTIPAIEWLETYYSATLEAVVGGSVAATEHAVMCAGGKDDELETYRRLIEDVYPTGIVSIVSDTWDFWGVLTKTLPALKDKILARDGKLVIRPDSGDPVKIICGDPEAPVGSPAWFGAVELLDQAFGGHTTTERGFRVINAKVGLIYGDSITRERLEAILAGLEAKGYASTNVVFGIGSYNYQHVTRDTHGFAMKATYVERGGVGQAIFKDPKTDGGTKKSARGLLSVVYGPYGELVLQQDCTWEQEAGGELRTVFLDGIVENRQSLGSIRGIINQELSK